MAFTGRANRAKMVGGGRPHIPEILAETNPTSSKTLISYRYSLIASHP